ncbi:MAG: hypothetical protein NTZ97_01075, partial [Candidatus Moranbacteria bacterium]|nr:hypothetical protein [Candidatus Moranbacteria bacterium]
QGTAKIIVRNVVNEAGEPVFSYYDQTNTETNEASMTTLVKIFLRVNTNPNRVENDVVLESYSKLRNIKK